MLDVIVELVAPLVPGDDQVATTRTGAGGQAANVAAWARDLGAEARFVGKRGDDTAGELVTRELAGRGVGRGRTARRPHRRRRLARVSRRSHHGLRPGRRGRAHARRARPRMVRLRRAAHLRLLTAAAARWPTRRRRRPVSRGQAARASRSTCRRGRSSTTRSAPDYAASNPTSSSRPNASARRSAPIDTRWVIKRGADGLSVDGRDYPAVAATVVDTTGAGDALAAGFLVGGPELGLAAAGRCCGRLGAMP